MNENRGTRNIGEFITDLLENTQLSIRLNQETLLHGLWLFALAWAVRLGLLMAGGYSFLGWDERFYMRGAGRVLRGAFDENYFMPGWFYILSAAMKLSIEPRFFVTLIGALTAPFIFFIGRKLFDFKTGIVAALLMVFFPEHVFFSHYVMAEVVLVLLTAIGTWIAFSSRLSLSNARFQTAALFFGAGILYKHFTIVSFTALAVTFLYMRKKFSWPFLLGCFLFVAPILAYSGYIALEGGDPTLLINSPLKSFEEWDKNHPILRSDNTDKMEVLRTQMKKVLSRKFVSATKQNFFNLWTPNSLPISRIYRGRYSWIQNPQPVMIFIAVFYSVVVALGMAGLCFSRPTPFKFYSVLNLLFLSAMSGAVYIVPRYRLPFMIFFILWAARFITRPSLVLENEPKSLLLKSGVFVGLAVMLGFILARGFSTLGAWN